MSTALNARQVECIEALIVAGADVKAGAGDDMSPLHFAASKGHTEACRTLLAAGTYFFGYLLAGIILELSSLFLQVSSPL